MRFFSSCGFGAGTDVEMTNDSVRKSGFGVFFFMMVRFGFLQTEYCSVHLMIICSEVQTTVREC